MRLRYNNAIGQLGGSGLTAAGTTITFQSAPSFATLGAGDYIPLVLEPPVGSSPSANFEVVYLTAYTAGQATGTIQRGQEGTTAVAHNAGTTWVCAPTQADEMNGLGPSTALAGLVQGTETARNVTAPGRSCVLFEVQVDQPCRLRIYATAAQAAADVGRGQTADPTGNHGCLLEIVFAAAGAYNLSPIVTLVMQDSPASASFPCNVRCDNGTTLNVTLTGYTVEA